MTKISDSWRERNAKGQYLPEDSTYSSLQLWVKQRVTIDSANCWNWALCLHRDGYSKIQKCGFWQAHRLSYWAFYPITYNKNLLVLHKCHNRRCVNPEHLYQGTHKDNAQDTKAAGRMKKTFEAGEKHPNVKLDSDLVKCLRNEFACGKSVRQLGVDFGIPRTTVSAVCHRHSWRHLP